MLELFKKGFASVLILSLFFMMDLGFVLASTMTMNDGKMAPCPFMGMTSICNMSPVDHIVALQLLLVAVPSIGFAAVLFELVTLFSLVYVRRFYDPPQVLISPVRYYNKWPIEALFLVRFAIGESLNPRAP